ncbi:MAG TPA: 4'-phosphopantetheinyl transferase superfamily protein [Cyclobacteriaceae bacterium]|nr:4'-phosphopantetheinyl transferase superfamily protein [Cyclobacteriaceae bacterium]MCB9237183.1 4'-phosphopantetheinyl transferase superfamily protein [Flammeovirgaceae bacterium]MCB0499999.1 4'-phosphopantetheinyl transferase superfamily protein [Cyclobacteriaceae bacterium]MCO5270892.1 4'-phosphopantetheinyl transferase superfamily protein [Cyclobacteriaceae bacterium]MCW5901822.1 4'-phosphopantetheinyl transferase superfamily protein [Cyclobacteriaceae bacterium]
MPLQYLNGVNKGEVVLWHITESEHVLAGLLAPVNCPPNIANPQKRLEWMAGRLLLRHLAGASGLDYHGIEKDGFGKPFLKNHHHHISLSHSYPYVAAQLSPARPVGIDIEQPKEKLLRIAPRILDKTELENAGANITKHCIYWCAKEALYKIYGKRGLLFTHHLKLQPFELHEKGELLGWIETDGHRLYAELQYLVAPEYVLVYSKTS